MIVVSHCELVNDTERSQCNISDLMVCIVLDEVDLYTKEEGVRQEYTVQIQFL